MFLKKLFKFSKDYSHYLEKGDRLLAEERFAEARIAYGEALEKLESSDGPDPSQTEAVHQKIALTGNQLGRLNLVEAEYALNSGDRKKAGEHLLIIMELAEDQCLREKAEKLLAELDTGVSEAAPLLEVPDCSGCETGKAETAANQQHDTEGSITGEDRVALYFQTLPGDLPDRYAGMGEEFARACLLNLEGNGEGALQILENLPSPVENDILAYEKAILHYNAGDVEQCEQLLIMSIGMNPGNPLCNIGLVQLYSETDRDSEALQMLERMIANNILPHQAQLMQGDLYLKLEDETKALESYSGVLAAPPFAREAVGRIVPLLEKQGRTQEAANLVKRFAKGCC
jgi:tetratricopeptide (TPR) repeat protein